MPWLVSPLLAVFLAVLVTIPPAPALGRVALELDPRTGALRSLRYDGAECVEAPGADLEVNGDGASLGDPQTWKCVAVRGAGTARVEAERDAGPWRVVSLWETRGDEVRHRVLLRWMGSGRVKVRGVALVLPNLRLAVGAPTTYCIPGNFPVIWRRTGGGGAGRVVPEVGWTRGDYAVALMHAPSSGRFAVAGYAFEKDQARLSVSEGPTSVSVRHHFDVQAAIPPGGAIEVGTQVVAFGRGALPQMRVAMTRLSASLGNGPPADQPAHLARLALYEAHPWGRLETWPAGDRGNRFPRLTAMLPYLRQLGITGVWLLPVSWPPPWVYTLPAFGRVAPENGTPDELREFVRQAHRMSIKALIDLVVYGVHPDSPEVAKLPDGVWCRNEAGERERVWGGTVLAADCSHPAWQARIADVCRSWARDYGFDGTRLDCIGWGQALNWAHPERASAPIAWGGLQLNKVVRDAFRQMNRDAVTLPECGKPLVFRNADMVFDYPLYMALRDMTSTPRLADWIAQLRTWLEWERHAYAPRARRGLVRFLENHDTVSAAEYFGVGPSQALMAICTLIQGVPLVYQEQEIGFASDLSAWLRLRHAEPSFHAGEADYDAVSSSHGGVFAFLREHPDQTAVVAVNMTGKTIQCTLRWPASLGRRFPAVVDALRGIPVQMMSPASARVRIAPYRPVVLMLLRRGDRPRYRPDRALVRPRPVLAQPGPDGVVQMAHATRWRVETAEGVLEGPFWSFEARLRSGEPITALLQTLRPAWNPLESGLLDGTNRAAVEIARADGTAVRVEADPQHLRALAIENPAGDGRSVAVRVQADGDRPSSAAGRLAPVVEVDPQWVRVTAPACYLVLARRHGGVIAHLSRTPADPSVVGPGSDAYSDNGIFPARLYASVDGETKPRLQVEHLEEAVRVTFRGALRARSWNGVQSCPVASPTCAYRLAYTVDRRGRLTISLGIAPTQPVPDVRAFVGYRLPLPDVTGWEASTLRSDRPGTPGERALTMGQVGDAARVVRARSGALRITDPQGLQNLFVVPDGTGTTQLFLALLDGAPRNLDAVQELTGGVTMELLPSP